MDKKKNAWVQWSDIYGNDVTIHFEKHDYPYINCTRCGRSIRSFYVVQLPDGTEAAYLGKCCIKKL